MKQQSKERRENISKILLNRFYGENRVLKKMWGTRFYYCYNNLYRRCNSPKNNRYHRYGGRGIKCEWENFKHFFDDMYESYLKHCQEFGENDTSIDRIDNNGNYSKENCRWATHIEQMRTQQRTIKLTIKGETKSLREWSSYFNAEYKTVFARYRYGKKEKTIENLFKTKNV